MPRLKLCEKPTSRHGFFLSLSILSSSPHFRLGLDALYNKMQQDKSDVMAVINGEGKYRQFKVYSHGPTDHVGSVTRQKLGLILFFCRVVRHRLVVLHEIH
jgi:hypothetical protein